MTRSEDLKRVRRSGRSYAHPLLVLYFLHSDEPGVQVGVSAGLAVGNAVRRNRAKRLIRAAMRDLLPRTLQGSQLVIIARSSLSEATFLETREALTGLMDRAGLLTEIHAS